MGTSCKSFIIVSARVFLITCIVHTLASPCQAWPHTLTVPRALHTSSHSSYTRANILSSYTTPANTYFPSSTLSPHNTPTSINLSHKPITRIHSSPNINEDINPRHSPLYAWPYSGIKPRLSTHHAWPTKDAINPRPSAHHAHQPTKDAISTRPFTHNGRSNSEIWAEDARFWERKKPFNLTKLSGDANLVSAGSAQSSPWKKWTRKPAKEYLLNKEKSEKLSSIFRLDQDVSLMKLLKAKHAQFAEANTTLNRSSKFGSLPQPGTKTLPQPGTKTLPQPGTKNLTQPGTKNLPQPGTKTLPQPGTKNLPQPGTKNLPQPGTKTLPQPGTKNLPQPGTKNLPQPGTKTLPQPGTKNLPQPGTKTLPQPGTKNLPQPGTKTLPQPGTKNLPQPGTKTLPQPGTKNLPQPGTKNLPQPGTKTLPHPGTKKASPRHPEATDTWVTQSNNLHYRKVPKDGELQNVEGRVMQTVDVAEDGEVLRITDSLASTAGPSLVTPFSPWTYRAGLVNRGLRHVLTQSKHKAPTLLRVDELMVNSIKSLELEYSSKEHLGLECCKTDNHLEVEYISKQLYFKEGMSEQQRHGQHSTSSEQNQQQENDSPQNDLHQKNVNAEQNVHSEDTKADQEHLMKHTEADQDLQMKHTKSDQDIQMKHTEAELYFHMKHTNTEKHLQVKHIKELQQEHIYAEQDLKNEYTGTETALQQKSSYSEQSTHQKQNTQGHELQPELTSNVSLIYKAMIAPNTALGGLESQTALSRIMVIGNIKEDNVEFHEQINEPCQESSEKSKKSLTREKIKAGELELLLEPVFKSHLLKRSIDSTSKSRRKTGIYRLFDAHSHPLSLSSASSLLNGEATNVENVIQRLRTTPTLHLSLQEQEERSTTPLPQPQWNHGEKAGVIHRPTQPKQGQRTTVPIYPNQQEHVEVITTPIYSFQQEPGQRTIAPARPAQQAFSQDTIHQQFVHHITEDRPGKSYDFQNSLHLHPTSKRKQIFQFQKNIEPEHKVKEEAQATVGYADNTSDNDHTYGGRSGERLTKKQNIALVSSGSNNVFSRSISSRPQEYLTTDPTGGPDKHFVKHVGRRKIGSSRDGRASVKKYLDYLRRKKRNVVQASEGQFDSSVVAGEGSGTLASSYTSSLIPHHNSSLKHTHTLQVFHSAEKGSWTTFAAGTTKVIKDNKTNKMAGKMSSLETSSGYTQLGSENRSSVVNKTSHLGTPTDINQEVLFLEELSMRNNANFSLVIDEDMEEQDFSFLPPGFEKMDESVGCSCWATHDGDSNKQEMECRCQGEHIVQLPANLSADVDRLTLTKMGLESLGQRNLSLYSSSLSELILRDVKRLRTINEDCFINMTHLRTM
ncbi:uncharacterized protein [Procambarus clarkii]|uniref:uncharacterized protein n=1 Tax=Procambarus clarkii TaxID=6728 RepID=UPI003742D210